MPGPRLTRTEREEIAIGTELGETLDQIAERIGRAPSTVSRERTRNGPRGGAYRACTAQRAADVRARRPRVCRLVADRALALLVEGLLEECWSPQQIAGRLLVEHPDQPERRVSHETIYQALYMRGRGGLRAELTDALRTGRARRRPSGPNPGRGTRD